MAIDPLNPAPRLQPVMNSDGSLNYDWDRFFYNTYSTVNGLVSTTATSNLLLNGTFNFQNGIATPVTQTNGDGAYVAEKWQIHGSASANYAVTSTQYPLSNSILTNSSYYEDINVTSYNGGDLYLYQRFIGLQHVRSILRRDISISFVCTNFSNSTVALQFGIYRFYDPSDSLVLSRAINLTQGVNVLSTLIDQSSLSLPDGTTAGASPYLEFRIYIKEFTSACHIALHGIKVEFGKYATPNVVDNFIERTRINNA